MADSTVVLHLYRRLLRAATYLPDSFARVYVHNRVVDRFRRNAKRQIPESINAGRARVARSSARILERAGNGSLEDLKKILLLTYGRKGNRRRDLIQVLLRPDENILPKDDLALKHFINSPNGEQAAKHEPSPKLKAFIESQQNNQPAEAIKPKIRKLQIPKENIWGRAVPRKHEIKMRKQWWAMTLDRLLPPVPQHEWDRLRDLALGKIPLDEVPQRRSRPEKPVEDQEEEMRVFRYLQHRLKAKASEFEDVEFDPERGLVAQTRNQTGIDQLNGKTQIDSPRTLRRLYGSIWSLTPTMSQDEVTKKWNIQWGSGRSQFLSGRITQPSASDLELFEGIQTLPAPQPESPHTHHSKSDQFRQFGRQQAKATTQTI